MIHFEHPMYDKIKADMRKGWKTWNVRSVLSHVRMQDGLALNIGMKEYKSGCYLKEALIGRQGSQRPMAGTAQERVYPGLHAYDDRYTEMRVEWVDINFTVESSIDGEDLLLLVTPIKTQRYPSMLVLETGYLWNRPGTIVHDGNGLIAISGGQGTPIRCTEETRAYDGNIAIQTPCIMVEFTQPIAFYTGRQRGLDEISAFIRKQRASLRAELDQFGEFASVYEAIQCAMAWDTTYDAMFDRVASPISRLWSLNWGGFVLACWDNYFAAFMASLQSKELAYANLIEITGECTSSGFIPNIACSTGFASEDRSQPPVGSRMLLEIYKKYGEKWIVELLYPTIFQWNLWFKENRSSDTGALCWGSTPYPGIRDNQWETNGVNDTFGGALESGMDNSPLYDDVPFDKEKHIMRMEDVGLTGLYIMDCKALAELARLIGKEEDAQVLKARQMEAQAGLEGMWSEERGCYYNRRTDTGELTHRIAPTSFYALFADGIPVERARRMAAEHYFNPEEFYGDWVMPSIARNDAAYADQDYWRGRVWPSMNFLAYLAMREQDIPDAREDMANRSLNLMMKEWTEHRHIHENYNGDTGSGCDVVNSDKFYHWGALLGVIYLLEKKAIS